MGTGVELLLLAGSAGMSAYSSIEAGNAAQRAANATARELNTQAGQEQDAANAEAENIRKATRQHVASATAALAASGVSVDEGSPLVISEDIYRRGEQDALMTILTGQRRANALGREARNTAKAGAAAKKAGYTSAITSALGAAAQGMTASGWRSNGPGFSGTQAPAPVETRTIKVS